MNYYFLLIHSDSHGMPVTYTDYNHVVLLSDNPNMMAVNQMTLGANYPNADCVVADTVAFLHDWLYISVSGLTIEHDEGTTATGTTFVGLIAGLADFGVSAREIQGDPPANLYVMNPAIGTVFTPAEAGPYRAASQHYFVTITSAQPGVNPSPVPSPPALKEDGMGASFVTPDGTQARFWVTPAGDIDESWYTGGVWHGPVDASASWWGDAGSIAGGLSATSLPDGTQLVFWTGKDGHQWEAWYANNVWHGPVLLPGT